MPSKRRRKTDLPRDPTWSFGMMVALCNRAHTRWPETSPLEDKIPPRTFPIAGKQGIYFYTRVRTVDKNNNGEWKYLYRVWRFMTAMHQVQRVLSHEQITSEARCCALLHQLLLKEAYTYVPGEPLV